MKKLSFLLAVFYTLQANAQPYSINFAGTGLSTVKVQNLTTSVIVDVPAGDVLLLSTTTGIPEVNNMKSSGLKVYPNPMTDKSTLEILPPLAGDVIISVYDMTGKVITQFKGYLENYTQEFCLSGIKSGFHLINVQGNGYQFSEKLLSNGKSNGTAIIDRVSNNIQAVSENKSINDSKGVQATIDMAYNTGERLKYTAVSGNNRTVMTDIPTADKTVTFTFTECKDGDGNYYPVVQINTQLWMAENLKTTKYRNAELIGTTTPATLDISSESTPKYQWAYEGNESNIATYGRLYTWYAITDSRNVCPTGWYVPVDADWETLTTYLGDAWVAGGKLKETGTTHWATPNTGASNETGFTALPGGFRDINGTFYNGSAGTAGSWWSVTVIKFSTAWNRNMFYHSGTLESVETDEWEGLSVRCLQGEQVLTIAASSITQTTATSGGNVTSDGGETVTTRGVCWNTSANPTIADNHTSDGTGTGIFSSNLTGLILNTTYFVRAYIINSVGTTYGNEISFSTRGETGTVSDIDGNTYSTIEIGTQVWMAENLKTTKYRNGDLIGTTTPATLDITSESTPKYQWAYDGNESNVAAYGRLYTWYSVTDNRCVCPTGWHVPTNAEWTTLTSYLGGESVAGGKLKETGTTHWLSPNTGATNESGFTALPGGHRDIDGFFDSIEFDGEVWSATEDNATFALDRYMYYSSSDVVGASYDKKVGFAVRCLKD